MEVITSVLVFDSRTELDHSWRFSLDLVGSQAVLANHSMRVNV